ncbi:MAG: tetratricopeptide repeat protein [Blastocatellia bacterium]
MKNPGKENKPSPPETKPTPETKAASDDPRQEPPDTSKNTEVADQDPKAISESLRRIRTSGPLIIEAIKQNRDRVNEIIALSVQGMNENKADVRREEVKAPPPPPAPPPVQRSRKAGKPANRSQPAQAPRPMSAKPASGIPANTRPVNTRPANTGPANARQNNQTSLQTTAQSIRQSIAQTGAQTVAAAVAMTQSVTRKTTGLLSGSTANRSNTQVTNVGQLSPNGPSTVLVQASGFKPQSGFASKVRIVLIALAILLGAGAYFKFRDKLLPQAYMAEEGDRNLVSPEDRSAQLVKLGESDRAQGKYDTAMEHFQSALELAPNSPDIRFLLAQTYLVTGQTDESMKGYQEILRIAPEHLDARLQLAEIYRVRGNWNAAYKEYKNIIELNQNSPQAVFALEAIEKQQDSEKPDAQTVKNSSLRRNRVPRPSAPTLPGGALRAQVPLLPQRMTAAPGVNPPAALSSARPEERPDPRVVAETHRKLGVRYLNIRLFREAINEFLQALSLTPNDKDLYYFIGSSYHGMGQYAEAYDYYRRVDSGPYFGPAQSGTKQTEKAAKEANRRREAQKFQSIRDEPRNEPDNNKSNRSLVNKIFNSIK